MIRKMHCYYSQHCNFLSENAILVLIIPIKAFLLFPRISNDRVSSAVNRYLDHSNTYKDTFNLGLAYRGLDHDHHGGEKHGSMQAGTHDAGEVVEKTGTSKMAGSRKGQ